MKLSEAIRLGAMLKPQGLGGRMDGPTSCALAGASDAAGVVAEYQPAYCHDSINYDALSTRFPILKLIVAHPRGAVKGVSASVQSVIIDLNDEYRFTREEIADWVEGVEAAQEHGQSASTNAVDLVAHDQLVLTPRA